MTGVLLGRRCCLLASLLALTFASGCDAATPCDGGAECGDADVSPTDGGQRDANADAGAVDPDAGPCDDATSHASSACADGDVHWFDSCGVQEEVQVECGPLGCADGVCTPVPDGVLALHGFEVRDTEPDRIYFRSTVPLEGSTAEGFVVPDDSTSNTPSEEPHYTNSVTAVDIAAGALSGHYFTLAHAYVYGDNVLLKYDGGSNLEDLEGAALRTFTHRRVENRIAEPDYTGAVYYVTTDGDDDNTGLSETESWRTIAHAAQTAEAGDTVHIQAGDYGAEHVVFANSGTADDRILFEGYTSTPGDGPDLGWQYGEQDIDSAVMPLIDGGNRNAGFGLDLFVNANHHITIRNVQVTRYAEAVRGRNNAYLQIENVVVTDLGLREYSGHGFTFIGVSYNNTFRDCVVSNATATGFRLYGYFNHVVDSSVYCDEFDGDAGGDHEPIDYYTTLRGDWNYLGGLHLERVGDLEHGGHGITFKGDRDLGFAIGSVANNLAEDSTVIHMNGSVELRHRMVHDNTVRGIRIDTTPPYATGRTGGIDIRDGASRNVVEGCVINGVKNGISFFDGSEDQGAQLIGRDNIVRNCVFSHIDGSVIRMDSFNAPTDDMTGNQILHCTFHDAPILFAGNPAGDTSGNVFSGNIVSEVDSAGSGAGVFTQTDNNYIDGFAAPSGEGNVSLSPGFEDAGADDFHLAEGSACLDVGPVSMPVLDDLEGIARPQGDGPDLGAFERAVPPEE